MSISLVGDYGGSDSSDEESEGESEEEKQAEMTKPKVALPSAADLLDSVDAATFMSPSATTTESFITTPKRKIARQSGKTSVVNGGEKKTKLEAKGETSRGFIPPQMSRPNVVTEDAALWSSDATLKRQKKAAGKKEGLTYKQREKVKRDKGQSSRGKSYVEEEKRLLRELGSPP